MTTETETRNDSPLYTAFLAEKKDRKRARARVIKLEKRVAELEAAAATPAVAQPSVIAETAGEEFDADVYVATKVAESRNAWEEKLVRYRLASLKLSTQDAAGKLIDSIIAPRVDRMLLLPVVTSRLEGELDAAGEFALHVLDREGARSVMTLDTLRAELRADPALRTLVRGESDAERAEHRRLVAAAIGGA